MKKGGGRFGKATCLLAMLALWFPLGCGVKNNPVPPQHVVPNPVLDLKAEVTDQGAVLSWSYPRETVTGETVEEIEGFALCRAEIPVDSYCKTCPIPYSAVIEVPGGLLADGGKTASYEAKDLRPGNLYFFKVRSQSGWWRESKDSNEVSFLWQTPPLAPEGLTATAGDGRNSLQWQAVTRLRDGASLTVPVRYQLYRGVDNGSMAQLGGPLAATAYTDSEVENGRTYTYQVQAANTYAHGTVHSALSATVQAKPLDRTPPPVPAGVEGIRTEVGVKLYWDQIEFDDLAGYRIYRRAPGGEIVRVGEVFLPYTMFIDSKAPGGTLLYSVSAIDRRNPANESARSEEIVIEP